MQKNSRVHNSIRNSTYGIIAAVVASVMGFVVRTIFVMYLDSAYLGVNGLFTQILTILSLADLGFGVAIVHAMYKPIYEKDTRKLQILMELYKKIFTIIGVVVAAAGLAVIPFMDYIIKDKPDIPNLTFIYCLFLMSSSFSYFFAYRRAILSADQKEYINTKYKYYFIIIKSVFQIAVVILLRNFVAYLVIQVLCTVAENIYLSQKVKKMYPFLREKANEKLPKAEVAIIKNDIKAMALTRMGFILLNGTDNIIISSFVGIVAVGFLSNYMLLTTVVVTVLTQLTSGITGSVGNFVAGEKPEEQYKLFKRIDFAIFWLYGFSAICLATLLNPFVFLWLGSEFLFDTSIILVISANFLIEGLLSICWLFRSTMGLFVQGRYRAILSAVVNVILSLILVKYLGVFGVLIGTTISRVAVDLFYAPYIIFKHGLKRSVKSYYATYGRRIFLLGAIAVFLAAVSYLIVGTNVTVLKFIVLLIITVSVPNICFFLAFKKKEEFLYFKDLLIRFIPAKLLRKKK
ncbi:sugar translocase [Clostridia bacterium]|nr:sugar translocase [Clostridia bacterium]